MHNFPPNDICINFLQCSWSCGILWQSMGVESSWAILGLVFWWHPTHGAWVAGFVAELALPMYWSAQFAGDSRCL